MKNQHVIEKIVLEIVELISPLQIYVFGSTVKGQSIPNDLDLFIVIKNRIHCRKTAQTLYKKINRYGLSIDFVVATQTQAQQELNNNESQSIINTALAEGVIVYGKKSD